MDIVQYGEAALRHVDDLSLEQFAESELRQHAAAHALMATGSGKTLVMAMAAAWHILNKVAYPQDTRFSKHVLVMAPGLTVKSRLAVLGPAATGNYYEAFDIVPAALMDKLRQGNVRVLNWHALAWESDEQKQRRRSVDKRGALSDEAYTRQVLGDMAGARNLLVLNDEAHHAWRANWEAEGKYLRSRDMKDSAEEATVWVGGLDRLQRSRGLLGCYDFSATPFTPSGKSSKEEALFGWIVSDFGLNDAIESGLVKTPRVVVRDDAVPDAGTFKSKLYHLYNDDTVKADLNSPAKPEVPLPDLVRNAYLLLGQDWLVTRKAWAEQGAAVPPVMITVCNRTETAARIHHAFARGAIEVESLCAPEGLLHIDSKVLLAAEAQDQAAEAAAAGPNAESGDEDSPPENADFPVERRLTKQQQAELLRRTVDTVGQIGQPGEQIQNVISVGMLSEGWDAKTVTHVMGLRAFSSQLLCEQVVGRGLRRTSYEVDPDTGLFQPEYVNIFGVPFSFLPHEGGDDGPLPPASPKRTVQVVPDKARYEIRWPNIVRVDHVYLPQLRLDTAIAPLELDASRTPQIAELAPVLEGQPDISKITRIDLEALALRNRTQRLIFETARNVFDQLRPDWRGNRELLLAQLVRIVEGFIVSDRLTIHPPLFNQSDLRRRLVITLNLSAVVQHVTQAVRQANTEHLVPVFDQDKPIRSTADMRTWYTGKPVESARKSHINVVVLDSAWESSDAFALDNSPRVAAWAKNDHLGFELPYVYHGVVRSYRPDFLVRLRGSGDGDSVDDDDDDDAFGEGEMLILETKGQMDDQEVAKQQALDEWVRAVNAQGGFGRWRWAVAGRPGEVLGVLGSEKDPRS